MCKIKIIRAIIKDSIGKQILKPKEFVIDKKDIEVYRSSLKREPDAKVLLTFEEIEE